MGTKTKPEFSAAELEHYKAMVGIIINGDTNKKQELDGAARLAIAQAKKSMPTAETETLVTFFASIAFMLAHLMTTQVKNIGEVIENTFDSYTVAAAHIMGAYDIEGSEMPIKPEPPKDQYAASTNDTNTGLYL
jgi:hypothetical protein